jgi:hypothetical protein
MQEKISNTTQNAYLNVTEFLDTYPLDAQRALPIVRREAEPTQDEDETEIDAEIRALRADNRRLSAEIGTMYRLLAKMRATRAN